jgi:hypothetical protein
VRAAASLSWPGIKWQYCASVKDALLCPSLEETDQNLAGESGRDGYTPAELVDHEILGSTTLEFASERAVGVELRRSIMPLFWTDSIVMSYSDVNAAKQWWITAFDCKQVPVPDDWDEPLPSDIAPQFSGDDVPRVLLSSRSEGREPSGHPSIFTGKLKKAYDHLRNCGILAGAIHADGGTELFEISDPEGNVIEVCKEP